MSLTTSEKIFIDPKDEITFVVERVLHAQKDKVIIVVPQNSLLMSSLVSVEILFRKIAKSTKLSIIVTEDDYGRHIAIRAGFIVVPKVSQISASLWDEMQKLKDDYLISLSKSINKIKDEFNEKIEPISENLPISQEVLLPIEGELDQSDELFSESSDIDTAQEIAEISDEDLIQAEDEVEIESEESKIDREIMEKYNKPRQEPKVVEIGGLKILAGGDIKSYIDNAQNDKMQEISDEDMDDSFDRKIKITGSDTFTGKDFTRAVYSDKKDGFFSRFFGKKRKAVESVEKIEEDLNASIKRRKKLLIGGSVTLVVLIVGFLLLAFQFSNVDINLKLKKQSVETSASMVVDLGIEEINFDPLIIPGKFVEIKPENNSLSKTGTADGKSKKGNKASGLVRILNLLESKVTLPAGTEFTNISTNLIYVTKTEIVLEAASTTTDGAIEPYIKEDVPLEASQVGPSYNIENSSSGTKFKIKGYDTTQISATQYIEFTGGTEQEFTSVSQENVDKLKDVIVPELKKQALERLRGNVPTGYKLIEQSIVYDETKAPESLPKVGEEATDGQFNLSIQIGISGLTVKSQDLISAVSYILANSKSSDPTVKFEVADISDPNIDKVEKNNDNYILTLTSQGSLTTQFSVDEIKKEIAGKTVEQANDYFKFIDSIEEYKVTFSPGFIPASLQRIPSDTSRVNVRTR